MPNSTSRKRRGSGSHHALHVVGTSSRSPAGPLEQRPPRANRSPPSKNRSPSTTRAPPPLNQQNKTTGEGGSILIKLSNACNKHAEHHIKKQQQQQQQQLQQQRGSTSDGTEPFDVRPDPNADESTLPKMCNSAIQTLRKLLPKVEKTIQALDLDDDGDDNHNNNHNSNTNKRRTGHNNKAKPKETPMGPPEASDVAHLCDFYHSVMGGVYCPHAPHLFRWGKGGIDGKTAHEIHIHSFVQEDKRRHCLGPSWSTQSWGVLLWIFLVVLEDCLDFFLEAPLIRPAILSSHPPLPIVRDQFISSPPSCASPVPASNDTSRYCRFKGQGNNGIDATNPRINNNNNSTIYGSGW
jgi:hypothetical protein